MSIIGVITENNQSHEIIAAAMNVLEVVSDKYSLRIDYKDLLVGEASTEKYGLELSESTLESAESCDYIIAANISYDNSSSILKLVDRLGLRFNFNWLYTCKELNSLSKRRNLGDKELDIILLSDVSKAVYCEEQDIYMDNGIVHAYDNIKGVETEIEKLVKLGFDLAMKRRKCLFGVDRSNIMQTAKLWKMVVNSVGVDYPLVHFKERLLEEFMIEAFEDVTTFDVIISDCFLNGLILAQLCVTIGSNSIPCAYLNGENRGLYSVYNTSSKNTGFIALLLSMSMMLRDSFNNEDAADDILDSIKVVLSHSLEKSDLASFHMDSISAIEFGDSVAKNIIEK